MKAFFICSLKYFSIVHAAFIDKTCFLVVAVHLSSDSQSVILLLLTSSLRLRSCKQVSSQVKYAVGVCACHRLPIHVDPCAD